MRFALLNLPAIRDDQTHKRIFLAGERILDLDLERGALPRAYPELVRLNPRARALRAKIDSFQRQQFTMQPVDDLAALGQHVQVIGIDPMWLPVPGEDHVGVD